MRRAAAWLAIVLALTSCTDAGSSPQRAPTAIRAGETTSQPAASVTSVDDTTKPLTRADAEREIAWLSEQLRVPAGNPKSPWALAHGLLAFGKDFKAADGREAVEVIASFAERTEDGKAYRFPAQRDGQPVEPHLHMLLKKLLEVGVSPSRALRASDGAEITLAQLLASLRAQVRMPETETDWRHSAWWITALEMDPAADTAFMGQLRAASLQELENETAMIPPDANGPLSPTSPMGVAKRSKSLIFGHPCGGLHFIQAVLRGAAKLDASQPVDRYTRQVRLLLSRYRAEHALYAQLVHAQPEAALLVRVQQLKLYGHVMETLTVAQAVGLLQRDADLATQVSAARKEISAALVGVIEHLRSLGAYARLDALSAEQPQLALDLIGDGCHAIHGLRDSLPLLPKK